MRMKQSGVILDPNTYKKLKEFSVFNRISQSEIIRVLVENTKIKIDNIRNTGTVIQKGRKNKTNNITVLASLPDVLLYKLNTMKLENNASYSEIVRCLIQNADFSKMKFKTRSEISQEAKKIKLEVHTMDMIMDLHIKKVQKDTTALKIEWEHKICDDFVNISKAKRTKKNCSVCDNIVNCIDKEIQQNKEELSELEKIPLRLDDTVLKEIINSYESTKKKLSILNNFKNNIKKDSVLQEANAILKKDIQKNKISK